MGRPLIKAGDSITLMGPTIGAFGTAAPFIIDVDLFGGAYKDTIYHGHLRRSGAPLEKRIISEDGTGEIYILYSLFYDATEAHIEVLLSDEAAAAAAATDSYGAIAASVSQIDRPGFSSLLFLKKSGQNINVGHNGLISLLRPIIAVPLRSHLFVDIHIRSSDYDEIVKGTIVFDAQPYPCHRTLGGKKGEIHVKVTWKVVSQVEESYVSESDSSEVSEDRSYYVPSPEELPQGDEGGHNV